MQSSPVILQEWYGDNTGHRSLIAEQAFKNALKELTAKADPASSQLLDGAKPTCIEDVGRLLESVGHQYQYSRKAKTLKRWLTKLSLRLHFYGNIFDMLVQHHPEYVSLAWGTMKLLIVGVINHENTIVTLLNALCEISDALPRAKLVAALYPTQHMSDVIEKLYTNLLLFFTRALEWYQESPWRHVLHSLTQPVELRFADLLDQIKVCSKNIDQVALSASQAEIRDIHGKVDLLVTSVTDVASRGQVQELDAKMNAFLAQPSDLSSKIELRIVKEMFIAIQKKLDDQTSSFREFVAQTIGLLAIRESARKVMQQPA